MAPGSHRRAALFPQVESPWGSRIRSKWYEFSVITAGAVAEWQNDKAQRLGASVAFYALVSLAPLAVVVVAVAAVFLGRQEAECELFRQAQYFMGPAGAETVIRIVDHARRPSAGITATTLSVLTLLWGASSVIVELRDALDTIWHVSASQGTGMFRGLAALVRDRFYSTLIVFTGGLLLACVTLGEVLVQIGNFFKPLLPIPEGALQALNMFITFLLITFVFAAIYKLLPAVRLRWSDVTIGAAVTAVLFVVGRFLIGLYLRKFGLRSAYGAAGSLVVIILWVYYSSQLLFLGAEFTKVYARTVGSHGTRQNEPLAGT